ncbi:hypothetical protein [Moorena sp. SIO2C4]|uniref:hypothetical protein n=1 Tax=Moorena sp. SIO2C4 TaxID=2607824 RepID=UPI0013C5AA68|nr:hypothetical protein [Moorena sp. SIO2C4]NES46240.1 hypothetical protein [Moorena sp. SIO2C4]
MGNSNLSYQLSAVSCQRSAVSYQRSAFSSRYLRCRQLILFKSTDCATRTLRQQ